MTIEQNGNWYHSFILYLKIIKIIKTRYYNGVIRVLKKEPVKYQV